MYKIKEATKDQILKIEIDFKKDNTENYYNWPDDNTYFNNNSIFIYEKNDVILGFILGNITYGYLDFVYVYKKYRGNKIGQRLIEYYTNIVYENKGIGIKIVCVTNEILNFWKKLGFKHELCTKDIYAENITENYYLSYLKILKILNFPITIIIKM